MTHSYPKLGQDLISVGTNLVIKLFCYIGSVDKTWFKLWNRIPPCSIYIYISSCWTFASQWSKYSQANYCYSFNILWKLKKLLISWRWLLWPENTSWETFWHSFCLIRCHVRNSTLIRASAPILFPSRDSKI